MTTQVSAPELALYNTAILRIRYELFHWCCSNFCQSSFRYILDDHTSFRLWGYTSLYHNLRKLGKNLFAVQFGQFLVWHFYESSLRYISDNHTSFRLWGCTSLYHNLRISGKNLLAVQFGQFWVLWGVVWCTDCLYFGNWPCFILFKLFVVWSLKMFICIGSFG